MRARLDAVIDAVEHAAPAAAPRCFGRRGVEGRFAGVQVGLAAAAILLVGVAIGRFVIPDGTEHANSPSEIAAMRSEMRDLREMVSISLMQQQSATDRLKGVTWSGQLDRPSGEVISALLDALMHDANVDGGITLTNVGGSVVAHAVDGNIAATIARVTPQAPMAFTSLNGDLDVTLPAAVKANLRLRSDQGDVFTDFDVQAITSASANRTQRNGRGVRVDVNRSIYGTVNGGGPDFELRTFEGNIYVRKAK
jgi:hypothetical protein